MTKVARLLVTTLQYALGFLAIWYLSYVIVHTMLGLFAGGLEKWK